MIPASITVAHVTPVNLFVTLIYGESSAKPLVAEDDFVGTLWT